MASKIQTRPLHLAVNPHNGRPGLQEEVQWRDKRGRTWKGLLGGQQLLIVLAVYLFKRLIAPVGRRFGKTTSVPFLITEEARLIRGQYYAIYVAQSHDKAYEMMDYCERFWGGVRDKKNPTGHVKERVGGPRDQRRYLEVYPIDQEGMTEEEKINTGIRVYFVSGAHPHYEKIRGYPHPMHRAILDEFSLIHPKLRKVIFPMLADAGGKMLGIGTTDEDGLGNDLFHLYYQRGLSEDPKYAEWGAMNFSSLANPTITEADFEEMLNDCVDQDEIDQEIYAKFLKGKGSVFSNLDAVFVLKPSVCNDDQDNWPGWCHEIAGAAIEARKKAPDEAMRPPAIWIAEDYNPAHEYVLSADWAKARDHTVMGVFDMVTMRQVALFQFHGDNFTELFIWARGIKEHYQAHEFHGDENTGAGQAMGDMLRGEYETGIIGHRFNTYNKAEYVRNGQIIFYEGRVELIDCPEQRHEFKVFKKFLPDTEKGEVRIRYGHPPGGNDDFVDSFLQIAGTVLEGVRDEITKPKKKGFNMVDEDGMLDMGAWDDAPTPETLEEWAEEFLD